MSRTHGAVTTRVERLRKYAVDGRVILAVYVAATLIASMQSLLLGPKIFAGEEYTNYNNFVIFKQSFFHLLENKDLYSPYPEEHWDLYKYSPTFALIFAPFAVVPASIGLILWNLTNALFVYLAFRHFPGTGEKTKAFMLWFVSLELLTSIQNTQSNGMIAGLVILAFVCLEQRRALLAALFIVLSVYVKLFGALAFALFLLYPQRWRLIGCSLFWLILLACAPLAVVSQEHLKSMYLSWYGLLSLDHTGSTGISVMGWLRTWFGLKPPKTLLVGAGMILFCLPFLKIRSYRDFGFRLMALASVLIWVTIFNHKAESPTYVIAISGVAVWYFPQKRRTENLILLCLAFVFTSLSPTDAFPSFLRRALVKPYVLKAVPCIFIWFKVVYEMTFDRYELEMIPRK